MEGVAAFDSRPHGSIFHVEDRWALNWQEIDEDEDAACRVRKDPEDWILSQTELAADGDLLDKYKEVAKSVDSVD